MTLRYPAPLNAEEWARVVENLKKGPTPKQVEIMKEARKWANHPTMPKTGSD